MVEQQSKPLVGRQPNFKTVTLLDPIFLPKDRSVLEVVLKAPTYDDFMELGEPEMWVPMTSGGGMFQTDMKILGQYLERLANRGGVGPNDLSLVTLADAMRLRDAVLSFFREAMVKAGLMTIRGTSSGEDSSSATDNPSATSDGSATST